MDSVLRYLKNTGRYFMRHGRILWLVVGIVFGMLFNIMPMIMMMMGGMGGPGGGMPKFPTAVEVALVKEGTLDDTVTVAGSLQADAGTTIKSEVTGKVTSLPLAEGQTVEKGTMLIVLDDATTSANLAQAKAQANLAERNLARLKQLKDEDAALVAQKDYDNALSNAEVARAGVKVAMAAYDKTHIAAPFSGTIGLRKVNVGDYVSPGQDLVSLQAMDVLKADFDLPERFAGTLSAGMPVKIIVDALNGQEVSASILAADPQINAGTRTIAVRAVVDNTDHNLHPGMFVRATSTLTHKDNALTIPEEAVVPEGSSKFVYRVIDGKAVKTPVTLGERASGQVEVVEGLKAHEAVVTAGIIKIGDGAAVVPTNITVGDSSATTAASGTNPLMPAVSQAPVSETVVSGTDISGSVK